MARSPLLRTLRRLIRRTDLARVGPSRRVFLGALGAAAAAPVLAACGDNAPSASPSIAIVGGGIAGLTAAHFLALAGVRAEIYESSTRVGGRMMTARGVLAAGTQFVELGAEEIDSLHGAIHALADAHGVAFDFNPGFGLPRTFHIGGIVLDDFALGPALASIADKMAGAVAAADDPAELARIDAMSIPEWLEDEAGLPASSDVRKLFEIAHLVEGGLEVAEQSAWNLITAINEGHPRVFDVLGHSDEIFRLHDGADALTTAMARRLADRIHLGHRLAKVTAADGGFELQFTTGEGEGEGDVDVAIEVDHVVYALPFTRLREVDLGGAGLSDGKRALIAELSYGTGSKLALQFTHRPWQDPPSFSNGGAFSDTGQLQRTTDSSRYELEEPYGILINSVGGARGRSIGDGTPEQQAQQVLPWIEQLFPGSTAAYLPGSAIRKHWPSDEHTGGSYACYRVGEWAFLGLEGRREGNQHFCGEHCSEDFQGTMEGGAETGAMVAAELLDDLAVTRPALLDELLADKVDRPRASYHAGAGSRMRISEVRRR
jgi:monoamine oxidase